MLEMFDAPGGDSRERSLGQCEGSFDRNRRSATHIRSDEKEEHMKTLSSAIVLGIGLLMVSGSPARAQLGGLGDAAQKGAGDAVKQELMKGAADKAGLPAPGAPAITPAAAAGAAVDEPKVAPASAGTPAAAPGAETGAATGPSGEAKVTPGAADAPAGAPAAAGEPKVAPGASGTVYDAGESLKKKMPKLP